MLAGELMHASSCIKVTLSLKKFYYLQLGEVLNVDSSFFKNAIDFREREGEGRKDQNINDENQ